MKKSPFRTFYTAGELASLFDIPKQTLLYYDKMQLLVPEYISENNYRHYSIRQYLTLEIIVNLRKLGVPVNQIRRYLDDRSMENFQELLQARRRECDEIIARAQRDKDTIDAVCNKIRKIRDSVYNAFFIRYEHEQRLFITDMTKITGSKERVTAYARHNTTAYSKNYFKEKSTGWIIDKDSYLVQHSLSAKAYYTTVSSKYHGPLASITRPAGLYLSIVIEGTFTKHGKRLADKFQAFIRQNDLEIAGDVYVMPLKDHWMTLDYDEYTVQVSIPIRYKNNI